MGIERKGKYTREQWRPITGYEGYYEVSDQGRVRRIKRGPRTWIGRILQPRKTQKGYYHVCLYKEGVSRNHYVHRLVLTAFNGKPKSGQEGNHLNGIKNDNRLEKLEWVTKSENELHKFHILGVQAAKGKQHYMAKLTNKDIPVIRRLLAEGKLLQKEIAKRFRVTQTTISYIKRGKNWAHI